MNNIERELDRRYKVDNVNDRMAFRQGAEWMSSFARVAYIAGYNDHALGNPLDYGAWLKIVQEE